MAANFEESKIFLKIAEEFAKIPCGSKMSTKSLYLTRLRRYKQICVFSFWAKIRKFKMAAIFGERKSFLKIVNTTLLRYPVDHNFRRNRSISHG